MKKDEKNTPIGINGIALDSFDGAHALRVQGLSKNVGEASKLRQGDSLPAQGQAPGSDVPHQGNIPASPKR